MANDSTHKILPDWLMILIFVVLVIALWTFGDTFTAIVGMLVLLRIFHLGYNKAHTEEDHH